MDEELRTTSRHEIGQSGLSNRAQSQTQSQVPMESTESLDENTADTADGGFSTTAIPDGGYGWVVVFCGSMTTFWVNGLVNCWGIFQATLLDTTLKGNSTSTVAFVGSFNQAISVACGLLAVRLARAAGSRTASLAGMSCLGVGLIIAGSSTNNVGGLFATIGMIAGVGCGTSYTINNIVPVQYFSGRLGLANGFVKLGGGIGGAVMALVLESLIRTVGLEWTLRIQGFMTLATGLPAAWYMKDRVPLRNVPFVDLSMFRNLSFLATFIGGMMATFALMVPPYYLPLFAQSIGLSTGTGAALVAAFNLCNAAGRFLSGPFSDKVGPANTLLLLMLLNALSMLTIWPVSDTIGPLVLFAILNGVANGAFFTIFPTVVASIFGPGRAAVAMSMSITGWTPGYLMGTPIAGYLLEAASGGHTVGRDINVYRPAIFYAGGTALLSFVFVLWARFNMSKQILHRV